MNKFLIPACLIAPMFLAAQAPPPAPAIPMPAILQNYKPVTADRLAKPEDTDWLSIRRTWDGWGYSPLTQITPRNVKQLQPAWVVSTGVTSGHEACGNHPIRPFSIEGRKESRGLGSCSGSYAETDGSRA